MFESKIEIPGHDGADAGDELRAVEWSELVARLAAQREVRGILLAREERGGASFNASAASMLLQHEESERSVNPDALNDRKYPWANAAAPAVGAAEGDREV